MDDLNYHHLHYFWTVARAGSIVRACQQLNVTQPTVSEQLKKLEEQLGTAVFERSGRHLKLTATGEKVLHYADQIFSLGRDLMVAVKGIDDRAKILNIGIVDHLPQLIGARLLRHAFHTDSRLTIHCRSGKLPDLLGGLTSYSLEILLTDEPLADDSPIRGISEKLGGSSVAWFGSLDLASRYREGFPKSLSEAPLLLPPAASRWRRDLDDWMARLRIPQRIAAELDDYELLAELGRSGLGLFPAPVAVEQELLRRPGLDLVARVPELQQQYYAILLEAVPYHASIPLLIAAARNDFANRS